MTPGTICEIAGRDGEVWTLECDILGGLTICFQDETETQECPIPAEVLAAFAKRAEALQ